FKGVVDLLKIAKHGSGENVYLVRFHYLPTSAGVARKPRRRRSAPPAAAGGRDSGPRHGSRG
ncbi:MAG TPA: hypothetical protein VN375_18545, partial [Vicinamibacteria bacterium]|nr:hypothetical protein [Vicinamibacteria bacterium]